MRVALTITVMLMVKVLAGAGAGKLTTSHAASAIAWQWSHVATDGPRGFRLALTGRVGEMLVSWTTPTAGAAGETLHYWHSQQHKNIKDRPKERERQDHSIPMASGSVCTPVQVALPRDNASVTMRCVLKGLLPGTRYTYGVDPSGQARHTARHTARTLRGGGFGGAPSSFVSAPLAGAQFTVDKYPLRIIAFGDVDWTDGRPGDPPGSNPADTGDSFRVSNATCRDFTVGQPAAVGHAGSRPPFNASLVLHVGDISYSGPNSGGNTTLGGMLWDVFLAEMECLSSRAPYMVAAGNHDVCPAGVSIDGYENWCDGDSGWECGCEYLARYKMPQSNFTAPRSGSVPARACLETYHSTAAHYWHTYTYGPVQFVVVSTEHNFAEGSPQLLWLASTLASVDRTATCVRLRCVCLVGGFVCAVPHMRPKQLCYAFLPTHTGTRAHAVCCVCSSVLACILT